MSILNNQKKYTSFREKYKVFRYKSYEIIDDNTFVILKFKFEIDDLDIFTPIIKLKKKNLNIGLEENYIEDKLIQKIVFNIGMVEAISYYKATCSPNFVIECGTLDEWQKEWFKKLYYNGLGEMLYRNSISVSSEELFQFETSGVDARYIEQSGKDNKEESIYKSFKKQGNLILVGGGKDSCVTLELLKDDFNINTGLIVGTRKAMEETLNVAGYESDKIIKVERNIDKRLLELNEEGFLNGHTPFSALLAFVSYFVATISKNKYIVLSNESSANESNIPGTNINHQYSKSYEFETDFMEYVNRYLNTDAKYFSLLRPLTELQIAYIFSKIDKFHRVFKSCNVGSKENIWCGNCPKCLFVYIILSPFLSSEKLYEIFGENLFEKEELKDIFVDLIGRGKIKPFECVGTFEEINLSICQTIKNISNIEDLPYLLTYYYNNYYNEFKEEFESINLLDKLKEYNENNNLSENFEEIIKGKLKNID